MAQKTYKIWSSGIQIAFFSKNTKNRPAVGIIQYLSYTSSLDTFPALNIFAI